MHRTGSVGGNTSVGQMKNSLGGFIIFDLKVEFY
jgi:hypothetical protein